MDGNRTNSHQIRDNENFSELCREIFIRSAKVVEIMPIPVMRI